MARLEKRRMTESANNPAPISRPSSTLVVNGLPPSHASNNEIENLLFKHEHESNQQFSVAIPENILLNHQMTNPMGHYASPVSSKRPRTSNEHGGSTMNGPLSPNKKSRMSTPDDTKISLGSHPTPGKSGKKNRNKQQQQQQQQQQSQPQTIIKTSASGIFPQQQAVTLQHIDESSDDVSQRSSFTLRDILFVRLAVESASNDG